MRGALILLLVGGFAGTADAATVPPVTAFPVVGNVRYIDDFGAPRPQGPHEGNDIMASRHQPVVAFEPGRVEIHYRSLSGNCMLYLHGRSGMTYVYIHLNNDLGATNDNRGGCRRGVAYAPGLRNGQWVRRGRLVGYVGDSGDADGIHPHLHFEVRTPGGRAIDPYAYLRRASRTLYPGPGGSNPVTLTFKGATVLAVAPGSLTIRTRSIVMSNGWRYRYVRRVTLAVPTDALVQQKTAAGLAAATLIPARVGQIVWAQTLPFVPGWTTQTAAPLMLAAGRIVLS